MTKVVFVGSFDPFHEGHADIVSRALSIFDRVVVGVGINPDKHYRQTPEERVRAIRSRYADCPRVEVDHYSGMTIDFARRHGATAIIKGVRNVDDFIYEQQQAEWNLLHGGIATLLMPADPRLKDISSTKIRQNIAKDNNKE